MQILRKLSIGVILMVVTSSAAFSGPNCTCRFSGQNYKTGEIACIRGKLSRCEFVLNNTSWKTIAETCPQATLPDIMQTPIESTQITLMARMQNRFSIK